MDDAVAALQVLAEPRRWRLVAELAHSDRRVGELTRLTGDPQNLVSYHLRELRSAGLVTSRRSSFDGRDSYYRADLARCEQVLRTAGGGLHPGLTLAASQMTATARGSVLFLCTGNSARSQMAEALLDVRTDGRVKARSAGSHPKPMHPFAVQVMAERGIDISAKRSKHLDRYARTRFDHVITLCDKVREVCPEWPGETRRAHWSVADPSLEGGNDAERYTAFERVAAELEERITYLLALLSAPRGGSHA